MNDESRVIRVPIRVTPGARLSRVGGEHDGALIVRVNAKAVDGKATLAALKALAQALGVPTRDVTLVSGATSRAKLVAIPAAAGELYTELRDLS